MIERSAYRMEVAGSLAQFRITALLGPRQCGKTTLARTFCGEGATYFDLEDPLDLARLETPRLTLDRLRGLVVIDEIQLRPDLFPLLRVLADRPGNPARFLILGSAAPELVKGIAESLAGRVGFVDMGGFDLQEVGSGEWERLWLRGGFPESFLGGSEAASWRWREQFIRTFLTRDIPQLGIQVPAEHLRRFWMMVAHYHGQLWNSSEIAASLGVTHKTAQRYLDILSGAFMLRVLPPWSENMGKRLRKAPKIHFRDSGLFHSLQGIRTLAELHAHPKLGASWEGFAVEQVLRALGAAPGEAYHWGTHAGAELDLLWVRGARRWGFEVKYSDSPRTTKSMRSAIEGLRLDRLFVIYPGAQEYELDERISVLPLAQVGRLAEPSP
jgi:predicted AAA+ superfamily ATPase